MPQNCLALTLRIRNPNNGIALKKEHRVTDYEKILIV